jgi:hypothetical protein
LGLAATAVPLSLRTAAAFLLLLLLWLLMAALVLLPARGREGCCSMLGPCCLACRPAQQLQHLNLIATGLLWLWHQPCCHCCRLALQLVLVLLQLLWVPC